MKRLLQAFVLVLAALSVLPVAVPAQAETIADCQAKISDLRAATLEATFSGQNAARDQAGLVGKLDTAAAKVEQGKFDDAVQALTQFREKVANLDAQGKLDSADAQTLVAGADNAIACVQSLSA